MVELTLVFLLGVLAAGLFWLLLMPAIWRRALRLTRERLERALPLDTNEILAERDRERAVMAVQTLSQDRRHAAMQAEVLAAKAEIGRLVTQESALRARIEALDSEGRTRAGEIARLERELSQRDQDMATLSAELTETQSQRTWALEGREAAEARMSEMAQRLEGERRTRDELDVHLQSARAAEDQERARAQALRVELAALMHERREAAR